MPEWFSLKWFSPSQLGQFTWDNPTMFYGLASIPLIFLFRWLLNKNREEKLSLDLPKDIKTKDSITLLRLLIPVFFTLGLTCLWIAAARPQKVLESEEEVTVGVNIVLALDISESMLTTDLVPNRFQAAKAVAKQFVSGRKNDKIGLVVFAGEAYSLCPLTSDQKLLQQYISEIEPSMVPISGTAIGNALAACINRLRNIPGESKVAILLSDGDNTAGDLEPLTAVELAKSFGIRIYTIAIGKNQSTGELDTQSLRKIATEGGGSFYQATDNNKLENIFAEISKVETTRFNNRVVKDVRDYYSTYLYWAISFFILSFVLKNSFLGNVLED
ncbi:Ca-activated chloride channel family protein [Spirosomataceae bacterium TFI 002]|nr:Ca-activated chloride channel family protein [Spirosomataceae bacterium TFI 002]